MPIRTNRGRAAVYRRLWGAPLRSPRHLIVTVVVLVVLIAAIGFIVPKVLPEGEQPAMTVGAGPSSSLAGPGQTSTPGQSAPPETRLTEDLSTPTSAPPAPEALAVVEKWATAWVDHPEGTTTEEWLSGLAPYTTEEYLAVMSSVDPANIPAKKVTGDPVAVNSFTSSLDADVATDGPTLRITVVSTDAGWRVASYSEAG
ncbi:MAG: hypothetical protein ACRDSE_10875 [Pseudonocardiaceae bacterium]